MAHIRSRKHAAPQQPATLTRCSAAVALALAVPVAQAQTPPPPKDTTLPTVNVRDKADSPKADTSANPKFTEPLVDTPQTITVIKKEVFEQQAATTLSEALRNTPGITLLMGENGNTATGDSISLRGFDSQGNIFVDGMRDLGTISRDVFNIEQIEVTKGASGSDFGRTSASGTINLVSKVPLADNFVSGMGSIGTEGQKRLQADWNTKLGDTTALRINVLAQDSDVAGRDKVKQERYGIAPGIAWGLNTPTRVYLYALYAEQDNRLDGGLSTIGLPGYYNAAFAPGGVAAGQSPSKTNTENFYGADSDNEDTTTSMVTARVEHDFGPNMTLRNTTRFGKNEQQYVLTGVNAVAFPSADPNTWTLARSRQGKEQENELATNQTNLSGRWKSGDITHAFSTGLELIREKQFSPAFAAVGTQQPANLYNPSTSDPFVPVAKTGATSDGKTDTIAAYLFDTMEIGANWQITAGLRIDRYDTEFTSVTAANATPPSVTTKLEDSDTLFSYKVAALYKPAPNGSVYVAYATSELPPGGTNFTLNATATNINNPNLDPQKSTNIEIGTKWDVLDGRLALTAALFRTENENDLSQADPVTGDITQYGKRRIQGIELGVAGQITPDWTITAGLTKLKAEVEQGTATQTGAVIQQTPELTFSAWTTYRLPFNLTLGLGARYVDELVRQVNNNPAPTTTGVFGIEDYWVFDAMASYPINPNWSLQLNVYNLADKEYASSLNNGGTRYIPGAPRYALLSATFKF